MIHEEATRWGDRTKILMLSQDPRRAKLSENRWTKKQIYLQREEKEPPLPQADL